VNMSKCFLRYKVKLPAANTEIIHLGTRLG
jgi:hypothetical protein